MFSYYYATRRLIINNHVKPHFRKVSSVKTTSNGIEKNPTFQYQKISFIGAGKMAEAMISPLISSQLQPAERIYIHDASTSVMNKFCDEFGVKKASSISEVIHDADLIVMAVKPQNTDLVCQEVKTAMMQSKTTYDPTILSIVAGKPINNFIQGCGGLIKKVARSMPNTPAMIRKGITVWTCTNNIDSKERNHIKNILCTFGKSVFVEDESYIDMATSLSGSGPAYIFLLMESMIDVGVHLGFSRDMATTIVQHTLLGSTLYAIESKEHPAVLRNSVTSPGGTTASGLYELENGRFRTVIHDAVWSCYRRSLEMGGKTSDVGPGRKKIPSGECIDNDQNNQT